MPQLKRRKYRIDVQTAHELLAWAEITATKEGVQCDVFIMPDALVQLAVYDMLLMAARNCCPFEREAVWLQKRTEEHARIEPSAYKAQYLRDHPEGLASEGDIPF